MFSSIIVRGDFASIMVTTRMCVLMQAVTSHPPIDLWVEAKLSLMVTTFPEWFYLGTL